MWFDVFGRFGDTNLTADESADLRASVKSGPQVGGGGTQEEEAGRKPHQILPGPDMTK